VILFNA